MNTADQLTAVLEKRDLCEVYLTDARKKYARRSTEKNKASVDNLESLLHLLDADIEALRQQIRSEESERLERERQTLPHMKVNKS